MWIFPKNEINNETKNEDSKISMSSTYSHYIPVEKEYDCQTLPLTLRSTETPKSKVWSYQNSDIKLKFFHNETNNT